METSLELEENLHTTRASISIIKLFDYKLKESFYE